MTAERQDKTYNFRPLTVADLPMLRQWLGTPEAVRWWGDPDKEHALLVDDLDDPRVSMNLVEFRGRAFAFIQDYDAHGWPQPHMTHLPPGTRAIDTFIGVPEMIGKGHGSAFLRMYTEGLTEHGAPMVVIDPFEANGRAARAYRKAGFGNEQRFDLKEGAVILMVFGM